MAVISYYAPAAGNAMLDATRLWVFELTADGSKWMQEAKVLQMEQRVGATPAAAIIEIETGTNNRATGSVVSPFERRADDAWDEQTRTFFDKYLEKDIVIAYHARDAQNSHSWRFYPLWIGTIVGVNPEFEPKAETVHLLCLDFRWKMQRVVVHGQYARTYVTSINGFDTWQVAHTDVPCVMNPIGLGNMEEDSDGLPVFGPPRAFESDNYTARADLRWTAKAALGYLSKRYLLPSYCRVVGWPSADINDDADMTLPTISLEDVPLNQAFGRIFRVIGYDWWVRPVDIEEQNADAARSDEAYLECASIRSGARRMMRLPAATEAAPANANTGWMQGGRITASIADSINTVTLKGQQKEYEAEWVLTKGWTAAQQTVVDASPDVAAEGSGEYDPQYYPVYRQWVLDEDGAYGTAGGTSQCTTVFGTDDFCRHMRRFERPYAPPEDPKRDFVVRVTVSGTDYTVTSGNIRRDPDRAGLTFAVPTVDAADGHGTLRAKDVDDNEVQFAVNEITGVKLTAILRSDQRLSYTAGRTDASAALADIEAATTDDTFRYIRRDASSFYADGQASTVLDDAADVQAAAERMRDNAMNLSVSASFAIPFIHLGFNLNDRIAAIDEPDGIGVAGRNLSLRTNRDGEAAYPRVVRIAHDFEAQQTVLQTTDDREAHF